MDNIDIINMLDIMKKMSKECDNITSNLSNLIETANLTNDNTYNSIDKIINNVGGIQYDLHRLLDIVEKDYEKN